jgi:hypothetical protein
VQNRRVGKDGEKDIRGLNFEGWREGQKGRKVWRKGHSGECMFKLA